jgi:hypothetical protein
MSDNISITAGSGTTIATDDVGGVQFQKIKLVDGTADSSTAIASGGGVEAGALRVTIASDSTGVVSIDDNGGAITVDGTVAVTNAGITSIDGKITACNTGAVVLAAGTAGIGKLTANSGVDIGDVDVTSLPAITGAVTANPSKLATTDDADFVRKYYTNAGAVTDGIVWSPAAGKRWYITDIIVNTSAAATVTFEDDKAGGDDPVLKLELAANGGFVSNFKTPFASGEDAADLLVTTSAGNIYICCVGYET